MLLKARSAPQRQLLTVQRALGRAHRQPAGRASMICFSGSHFLNPVVPESLKAMSQVLSKLNKHLQAGPDQAEQSNELGSFKARGSGLNKNPLE